MKLEPFNHSAKRWDRFKEFYVNVSGGVRYDWHEGPFVQFESGEFIVTQAHYKPAERRLYKDLNVAIYSTNDFNWKVLLHSHKLTAPDGRRIKPTWLSQRGSQTLWVDHDSGHVVATGRMRLDNTHIPKRFRSKAVVYYAAPDEAPIGSSPIDVSEVDMLDRQAKAHVMEIIAACKAWNALSEEAKVPLNWKTDHTSVWDNVTLNYTRNQYFIPPSKIGVDVLLKTDFVSMTWQQRKQVALRGVKSVRKVTEYTHLLLMPN